MSKKALAELIVAELIFRGADSAVVEKALSAGASGLLVGRGGLSPVIAACMRGAHKSLEALAAAGVDLLDYGPRRKTALMYAAWSGSTASANILIAAGSSCLDGDDEGWTPLMYAARAGHADMASLLLPRSNPLALNSEGKSALNLSSTEGVVRSILFVAELAAREEQLLQQATPRLGDGRGNARI